ncbi:MAG TPA: helix-turn-helix transcriptional regulator [Thermodesulfobacteriota bacterium]|nr:helix-turn-helix transcriptional regulator [Thermodesulfobacteriota bacterium]
MYKNKSIIKYLRLTGGIAKFLLVAIFISYPEWVVFLFPISDIFTSFFDFEHDVSCLSVLLREFLPYPFFMATIPNYIWKYRKRKKYGQKRIAHLLGHKNSAHLSSWERGRAHPTLQNAIKLALILGAPVEDLFGGLYRNLSREIDKRQGIISGGVERSGI